MKINNGLMPEKLQYITHSDMKSQSSLLMPEQRPPLFDVFITLPIKRNTHPRCIHQTIYSNLFYFKSQYLYVTYILTSPR